MKLLVKSIKKTIKKTDGVAETIYQCVMEGFEYAHNDTGDTVYGKLTLESSEPGSLREIVLQEIDSEVEIKFSHPQATLDTFSEK